MTKLHKAKTLFGRSGVYRDDFGGSYELYATEEGLALVNLYTGVVHKGIRNVSKQREVDVNGVENWTMTFEADNWQEVYA